MVGKKGRKESNLEKTHENEIKWSERKLKTCGQKRTQMRMKEIKIAFLKLKLKLAPRWSFIFFNFR